MKMTFRWFGESDSIPLAYIRQIPGMTGVVTAVYDCPPGEKWSEKSVARLKKAVNDAGLAMEVIESVPVHEDIKLGKPSRDRYIDNYAATIELLGAYGVRCVCYNFMPVFDWLRTELKKTAPDGSNSLSFDGAQMAALDPKKTALPGWDLSYTPEELGRLLDEYAGVDGETLFENLVYFLRRILPACEKAGVDMAIHPDDPPWDIFGLPRIITGEKNLDRLFAEVPDPHNGLTFCTGSLGAGRGNDIPYLAGKYARAGRIKFAHLRQIRFFGTDGFTETGHCTADGSLDMCAIVRALVQGGFDGYVRPDHGRNIWGEDGKPGYGLYDRALGAAYLNGLFEGVGKGGAYGA